MPKAPRVPASYAFQIRALQSLLSTIEKDDRFTKEEKATAIAEANKLTKLLTLSR